MMKRKQRKKIQLLCSYQISSDEGYYDRALDYYLQLSWVTQGAHYNLSINHMGQVAEKST